MIRARFLIFLTVLSFPFAGYSITEHITGIWNAAASGSLAQVQKEIAKGAAINQQDQTRGFTALMTAIERFQTHLVPDLLKLGADPRIVSIDGYSALSLAARNADIDLVKLLLNAGAKIDLRNDQVGTLVRQTLYSGSAEILQLLLDAGFEATRSIPNLIPDNTAKVNSTMPLHLAANKGNTQVVELLLKNGADVNVRSPNHENTALIYAIGGENPYTAKRLIELGADMSLVNEGNKGAFFFAAKCLHDDCAVVLMNAGAPIAGNHDDILSFAWKRGNAELVRYLQSKGLTLPAADPVNALLGAIRDNDPQLTKELLDSRFYDFAAQAHCVLGPAAAIGNPTILDHVHSFAGNGERLSDNDASGISQLHYTVMGNHPKAMDFYLRYRADKEDTDPLGQTPLMMAARLGRIEAMVKLHQAGASLEKQDSRGFNALDLALQAQQAEAVAWLESKGLKTSNTNRQPDAEPTITPVAPIQTALPKLTIALTSLSITDDAWFQSTEATKDFCILLQSKLETIEGLTWIERAEIAKAETEIKLTNSGLVTASQSLAIGQWIKADLIITGSLKPDNGQGRELELRITDAKRGDVLANRKILLKQPLAAPFTITQEAIEQASLATEAAISEARSRLQQSANQVVLAPLFIGNQSTLTARLDLPAAQLINLFQSAVNGKNIRLLNLSGSSDAYQEAELAISGLAQQDSQAWKQVADHYVWGWCEEIGAPETPFTEMPIRMTLELWSGAENTLKFTTETTPPLLESATRELIRQVLSSLPKLKESSKSGAEAVANALLLNAKKLIQGQGQAWFTDVNEWHIKRWKQIVKMLDAARFFSPNNAEIASYWTIERWSNLVYSEYTNKGRFTWKLEDLFRVKADWDHLISRFGFEGFTNIPTDGNFFTKKPSFEGSSYDYHPMSSWVAVSRNVAVRFTNMDFKSYDGLPPVERRRLQKDLCNEAALRYLQFRESVPQVQNPPISSMRDLIPYLPLPTRLSVAKAIFKDGQKAPEKITDLIQFKTTELQYFGLAGKHEEGLKALSISNFRSSGNSTISAKRSELMPAKPKVNFPVITSAFKTKPKSFLLKGPWGEQPLTIDETLSCGAFAILNLNYHDTQLSGDVSNLALWLPESSRIISIKPSPYRERNRVSFFAEGQGEIWMNDDQHGISRINLATKQQVFFTEADGTPFNKASSGAVAGSEFYCVGETEPKHPRIAAHHPSNGWRLVPMRLGDEEIQSKEIKLSSFNNLLYAYLTPSNNLLVLDTTTGLWRKLKTKSDSRFWYAAPDAAGFWGMEAHSVTLQPQDGGPSEAIDFPQEINWADGALFHDGDWLWIALTKSISGEATDAPCSYLLAIHKPTRSYRGCVDFPFPSR